MSEKDTWASVSPKGRRGKFAQEKVAKAKFVKEQNKGWSRPNWDQSVVRNSPPVSGGLPSLGKRR